VGVAQACEDRRHGTMPFLRLTGCTR
jgi:hypothetical protein